MTVFGELIGGSQIEQAVIDCLDEWMATYLKEVARQWKIEETFEKHRSIRAVSEFDRWPEQQLPAIVVVNGGTTDTPLKDGTGSYRAKWGIDICISVSAKTETETRRNAQLYITAARGCLMRRRSLGAGMKGTDWGGESYTLIDSEKRRSLAGAKASFVIEREDVVTVGAGPTKPDDDPYEDFPEVKSVEVEVEADN